MSRSHNPGISLSGQETVGGMVYLAFQFLALNTLLTWSNGHLAQPLSEAELNFVYYMINFISALLIFHRYLENSLSYAFHHIIDWCQAVILGLAAYYACMYVVEWVMELLVPSFSNYNDEAIAAMSSGHYFLMFIGTVILVPPVEECFYRGLIFRNLYGRSHWAAYIVSIVLFAMIHILGYIGQYSPLEMLMAVLQYLPAGLCLAWAYTKAGTIFAPIVIHAAINFITIRSLR